MSRILNDRYLSTLISVGIYSALISVNIFIVAPLFDLIKEEFMIPDVYVSLTSSLFYISLGLFSIIWAYMIDRNSWSRKKALIILTLLSATCSLTASISKTIVELIAAYTLAGVFLGGSFSLIFAILADRYPVKIRLSIFAIWNLMYGFGSSAGYFLSIMVGEGFGWRSVFLMSSLLIASSTIPLSFVKEPKIGESEELLRLVFDKNLTYSFRMQLKNLKDALKRATNRNLFVQYFFMSVGWGGFTGWFIHLVMRETGLTKTNTAIILGILVVVGSLHVYIAHLVQKKQGNKLNKKLVYGSIFALIEGTSYILLVTILRIKLDPVEGDLLQQIVGVFVLLVQHPHIFLLVIFSSIGTMLGSTTKPIDITTISEINLPEEKASIVGYLYIFELLGKGLGVFLAGAISTITGSLRLGLVICLSSYYLGSLFWYLASRSYDKDRKKQQTILSNRVNIILGSK